MKRYPKYKDSGIEWIGEIPEHWQDVQLKRCLRSVSNGTTANQVDHITDFPVSRIETISSGIIDTNKVGYLDKEDIEDKFILKKGDILLSHINSLEYVGNCAIYISEDLLIHGMNLLRLQSNQKTIPKFLLYYLKSHILKNQIQANSKHAINQVSLPSSSLKGLRIALPTNPEQQTIANYLGRKTHQVDTLIENKQKLIDLLKEQRAAIINHAVTKGLNPNVKQKDSGIEWLGEIPEHWEVKKLKYFGEIVLGKMLTPQDKGNYYKKPYLRARNILWEKVDPSDIKEMWFSEKELSQYRLKENDLLVSEGGEVGRTAIWKNELEECYIQNSVHKVTINESHNPFYFLYFFLIYGQAGHFDAIVNRVSIAHLTREKLKEVPFAIPPPTEQQSITDYLYKKTTRIDKSIEKQDKQIELLKEYRTALISEVVTGKIDVRDSGEPEVIHS